MSKEQHGIGNEQADNVPVGNGEAVSAINDDEAAREPTNTDSNENDVEMLQQTLEIQKQEVADNRDKMLRVQAEMDNLRKRTLRDMENAHKYALKEFVNELLPVIDSLELGLAAFESADNIGDVREGIALTLKQCIGVMEKFGIKVIDPDGEKFNPEQHEAVSMQATQEQEETDVVVVKVLQKGYQLHDRLVRPARVTVTK